MEPKEPRCRICGARKLDHSAQHLTCPIMDWQDGRYTTVDWHSMTQYEPEV